METYSMDTHGMAQSKWRTRQDWTLAPRSSGIQEPGKHHKYTSHRRWYHTQQTALKMCAYVCMWIPNSRIKSLSELICTMFLYFIVFVLHMTDVGRLTTTLCRTRCVANLMSAYLYTSLWASIAMRHAQAPLLESQSNSLRPMRTMRRHQSLSSLSSYFSNLKDGHGSSSLKALEKLLHHLRTVLDCKVRICCFILVRQIVLAEQITGVVQAQAPLIIWLGDTLKTLNDLYPHGWASRDDDKCTRMIKREEQGSVIQVLGATSSWSAPNHTHKVGQLQLFSFRPMSHPSISRSSNFVQVLVWIRRRTSPDTAFCNSMCLVSRHQPTDQTALYRGITWTGAGEVACTPAKQLFMNKSYIWCDFTRTMIPWTGQVSMIWSSNLSIFINCYSWSSNGYLHAPAPLYGCSLPKVRPLCPLARCPLCSPRGLRLEEWPCEIVNRAIVSLACFMKAFAHLKFGTQFCQHFFLMHDWGPKYHTSTKKWLRDKAHELPHFQANLCNLHNHHKAW